MFHCKISFVMEAFLLEGSYLQAQISKHFSGKFACIET